MHKNGAGSVYVENLVYCLVAIKLKCSLTCVTEGLKKVEMILDCS